MIGSDFNSYDTIMAAYLLAAVALENIAVIGLWEAAKHILPHIHLVWR